MKKFLILCCLLIILAPVTLYQLEKYEQKKQIETLTDLVDVGMNINVARSKLEKNGFQVGREHYPTGKENHGVVHIKIFKKFGLIDNASELFGFSWSVGKGYVALEFDKADNIVHIEK
ncbi:hypothetical protein [Desulfofustis glycolicus]|uniref:Uncharacterized protein n=1 Tax=Desulfofustis glycolicus DSM 9705 TaxID=1121409 RepID=A0A1M5YVA4_9BACT|nr:hypothetical protein [Desulfofustis glycolicus]SHI15784.1 hypothetical protein SAMN02745124_04477 [Desulfofustis glycolicus DSM 9705]